MPITMAQKPLMLKDFLELDLDSTSCGAFRCAPRRLPSSSSSSTIRCLLDAELSSRRLLRSRSKGAISAVVNLPRSLSKILLCRSFWRRRGDHTPQQPSIRVRVRDIVRLQSFNEVVVDDRRSLYFPSPVVSCCCSATSSDDGADSSDFMPSSCGSSEFSGETGGPAAAAEDKAGVGGGESYRETATGRWQTKEEVKNEVNEYGESGDCQSEEEEQLSPVSVMDFPSEGEEDGDGEDDGGRGYDDDEITASPQFRRVLDTIERTRQELLQKIRRFENLAELDLKPIDLESRFASTESVTSDDEEDRDAAWELLCRLKARTLEEDWPRSSEKLLLGFFDEGLSGFDSCQSRALQWRQRARANRCVEAVEEDLMKLATEWIGGHGCVRREDMAGAEQLKEMERGGGWMCLDEGEEEVAEEVEAGVLGWLVGELVLDLVSPSC